MRRILLPLLTTLAVVSLATALGVWQVHRLEWKRGVLNRIAAAEQAPAVPLSDDPRQFQKVVVQGLLDASAAVAYLDDVRDDSRGNPVMGTHLVEPLLRAGHRPLLVDLGWERYPPSPRTGAARIAGYVRAPEHPNWLSARDDPHGRRFYTLDPNRIGAAVGLPSVAPFTLIALGPPGTYHGLPDPAHTLPRPQNNHLQYAITWFSLALAASVMFLAWLRTVVGR